MHIYDIAIGMLPYLSNILLNVKKTAIMQCGSQGVYCGLSSASEVFLNLTTQLYACLCNCKAKVVIS